MSLAHVIDNIALEGTMRRAKEYMDTVAEGHVTADYLIEGVDYQKDLVASIDRKRYPNDTTYISTHNEDWDIVGAEGALENYIGKLTLDDDSVIWGYHPKLSHHSGGVNGYYDWVEYYDILNKDLLFAFGYQKTSTTVSGTVAHYYNGVIRNSVSSSESNIAIKSLDLYSTQNLPRVQSYLDIDKLSNMVKEKYSFINKPVIVESTKFDTEPTVDDIEHIYTTANGFTTNVNFYDAIGREFDAGVLVGAVPYVPEMVKVLDSGTEYENLAIRRVYPQSGALIGFAFRKDEFGYQDIQKMFPLYGIIRVGKVTDTVTPLSSYKEDAEDPTIITLTVENAKNYFFEHYYVTGYSDTRYTDYYFVEATNFYVTNSTDSSPDSVYQNYVIETYGQKYKYTTFGSHDVFIKTPEEVIAALLEKAPSKNELLKSYNYNTATHTVQTDGAFHDLYPTRIDDVIIDVTIAGGEQLTGYIANAMYFSTQQAGYNYITRFYDYVGNHVFDLVYYESSMTTNGVQTRFWGLSVKRDYLDDDTLGILHMDIYSTSRSKSLLQSTLDVNLLEQDLPHAMKWSTDNMDSAVSAEATKDNVGFIYTAESDITTNYYFNDQINRKYPKGVMFTAAKYTPQIHTVLDLGLSSFNLLLSGQYISTAFAILFSKTEFDYEELQNSYRAFDYMKLGTVYGSSSILNTYNEDTENAGAVTLVSEHLSSYGTNWFFITGISDTAYNDYYAMYVTRVSAANGGEISDDSAAIARAIDVFGEKYKWNVYSDHTASAINPDDLSKNVVVPDTLVETINANNSVVMFSSYDFYDAYPTFIENVVVRVTKSDGTIVWGYNPKPFAFSLPRNGYNTMSRFSDIAGNRLFDMCYNSSGTYVNDVLRHEWQIAIMDDIDESEIEWRTTEVRFYTPSSAPLVNAVIDKELLVDALPRALKFDQATQDNYTTTFEAAPSKEDVGRVYATNTAFTTSDYFIEGYGHHVAAGSNITVIQPKFTSVSDIFVDHADILTEFNYVSIENTDNVTMLLFDKTKFTMSQIRQMFKLGAPYKFGETSQSPDIVANRYVYPNGSEAPTLSAANATIYGYYYRLVTGYTELTDWYAVTVSAAMQVNNTYQEARTDALLLESANANIGARFSILGSGRRVMSTADARSLAKSIFTTTPSTGG